MSAAPVQPGPEARAVSARLLAQLRARIAQAGGFIPFDQFMDAALYTPGLGYYANGITPFGEQGDFITAPESGGLFGRCLARCFAPLLQSLDMPVVLELGAGSGVLARDLLMALAAHDALPSRYAILERSPAMRALQERQIATLPPPLRECLVWLDALPEAFEGVVFGNEVADALPVKRFHWTGPETREIGVGVDGEGLCWRERAASATDAQRMASLAAEHAWPDEPEGYVTETCPALGPWLQDLAGVLERGLLLLIDYGYGEAEYYHPQRTRGTLLCHYRHQAHDNALWYPGLQDITAFVDFTALATAGTEAGLELAAYTSQARFLLDAGIDAELAAADPDDPRRFLALSSEAKRLLFPGEMGERFKCMAFVRGIDADLPGLRGGDLRGRL